MQAAHYLDHLCLMSRVQAWLDSDLPTLIWGNGILSSLCSPLRWLFLAERRPKFSGCSSAVVLQLPLTQPQLMGTMLTELFAKLESMRSILMTTHSRTTQASELLVCWLTSSALTCQGLCPQLG